MSTIVDAATATAVVVATATTPEPTTAVPFEPYGFLLRGRQASSTYATIGGSTEKSLSEDFSKTLQLETEHGKYLEKHVDYIVPPTINSFGEEGPTTQRCLFIGHLRFETTTPEIRWIIKKLTGVTALRADIRGNGCCVVYLATDADVAAVRALNRRILFDRNGFWYARTGDAADYLMDYVEKVIPKMARTQTGRRRALFLPKDAVVVEDSRSGRRGRRTAPSTPMSTVNPTPMGTPTVAPPSPSYLQAPQRPSISIPEMAPGSARMSTAATPHQQPVSPFSTMSSAGGQSHSFNFHDCPPDYVHAPLMPDTYKAPPAPQQRAPYGCTQFNYE